MNEWKFEENMKTCDGKCPHKEEKKTIIIKERAANQIKTLTRRVSKLEWMAILQGEDKGKEIIIESLEIPEQEAQIGHIEVTKEGSKQAQEVEKKIGWIHSHNSGGVFFSRNDLETASQHKVSIVVNNSHEAKAIVKTRKPCGEEMLEEANIVTETMEEEELVKKIEERIKEKKQTNMTERYEWNGYGWSKTRTLKELVGEEETKEGKKPKGISRKEWKKMSKEEKRRKLEELNGAKVNWTGTCTHCKSRIKVHEEAIFRNGSLYHAECARENSYESLEDEMLY